MLVERRSLLTVFSSRGATWLESFDSDSEFVPFLDLVSFSRSSTLPGERSRKGNSLIDRAIQPSVICCSTHFDRN